MEAQRSRRHERLQERCRSALLRYRLDAFDNVNIQRYMEKQALSVDEARWIARHMMSNARSLDGYEEGRGIMEEACDAR